MMIKKRKKQIAVIALTPSIIIINYLIKKFPNFIEKYYSVGINKPVRQFLSFITGICPFSVAELLFIVLIISLISIMFSIFAGLRKRKFISRLLNLGVYLSILYVLFMLAWGFNYDRLSFDKIAGIKIEKSSKQDLYALCSSLVQRANELREKVVENNEGIMYIPGGYEDVFNRAQQGYDKAAVLYKELAGKYGRPKPVFLSEPMCYTGITGIYMPYTGEANVNIKVRDYMLPCTTAHEMAHQRGFAREDEANYIAYISCIAHPDTDFQYSGVMLALISSMNALAGADIDMYKELAKNYSVGVRADLKDDSNFWKKYEGKVEKISDNVNNAYLKSNGQKDGVQSYGRMVDLLLAQYRADTGK